MAHRNILLLLACVMAAPAQTPSRSENLLRLQLEGLRSRSSKLILFSGPGSTLTYPSAIDDGGTITGFYADANGGHGFLRGLDGGIVTFNAPGSEDIYPSSVNSGGAVTGNYGSAAQYGFLRTPDGAWITFTVPGTFPNSSENPIVVNDAGMIAGPYFDGSDFHGFIRTLDGSVSTLNAPGSTYTYATGLNASGAVTGIYTDANYVTHGFLRAIDGTWTSFDVPGNDFGFFPPTLSINSSGVVVGTYFDNENQGFLWQSGGSVTTFDVAGASGTQPSAINSSGTVVGSYQDASFTYHGFMRTSAGEVYTFSVPGAIATYAVGINDSGMIAGSYQDSADDSYGFLLIP